MYQDPEHNCVIVGAGPCGLATAAELRRHGVDALIVDEAEGIAASWTARYDGFRLNTARVLSYLPGLRIPRHYGPWPSRDAMVAYFEDYAKHHSLAPRLGVSVRRIDRDDSGWAINTHEGQLTARTVVLATGNYRTPAIPDWHGREDFSGVLLHSHEYRTPGPFAGQDVLVVGTGNSAGDIAVQLASRNTSRVRLSVRTPPHLVLRTSGPLPSDFVLLLLRYVPPAIVDRLARSNRRRTIGDLSSFGLPEPPDGIFTSMRDRHRIPTTADDLIRAVRSGAIEIVAAVESLSSDGVVLADGSTVTPDSVIAATGFKRDLEPLVGHLDALDDRGAPKVQGARTLPGCEGLHFIGYIEPRSPPLREFRLISRRLARQIARTLAVPAASGVEAAAISRGNE